MSKRHGFGGRDREVSNVKIMQKQGLYMMTNLETHEPNLKSTLTFFSRPCLGLPKSFPVLNTASVCLVVVTWKATGGVLFRSSFLFHSTLPHNTLTQTLSSFSLRFRGRAKLTSSLTVCCVSAFIRFTQVSKNCSLYLSLTLIIAFRRSIVFFCFSKLLQSLYYGLRCAE